MNETQGSACDNALVSMPFFTVFTPSYNRANTLDRVYSSLRAQTFRDFEWLIVDDGSSDGTADLVQRWQAEASFPIRYIFQTNRGKHVASNVGVREARGEMFLFFDSDDACFPEALERFHFHWTNIPESERTGYSTVSALCVDMDGNLIGNEYDSEVVHGDSVWDQMRLRSSGDRWGINRTDTLRRFPFPEISGERFISEGIVWNRISRSYRAKFVNERLKICEYRTDGLSASSIKLRSGNPIGMRLYYRELCELEIPLQQRIKALVNYLRFSFHARIPMRHIIGDSVHPWGALAFTILGYLAYRVDLRK